MSGVDGQVDSMLDRPDAAHRQRSRSSGRRHRHRRVASETRPFLTRLLQVTFAVAMLGAPLPRGGRDMWGWGALGAVLAILAAVAVVEALIRRRLRLQWTNVFLFLLVLSGIGLLQLLPCSALVGVLSPHAASAWRDAQAAGASVSGMTLSLLPSDTANQLRVLLAVTLAFLLARHLFWEQTDLPLLALVIVAAASLNFVLGLLQFVGAVEGYPWLNYRLNVHALNGTFRNRNHFALLMVMGFFVSLGGLLAAWSVGESRSHSPDESAPVSMRQALRRYRHGAAVVCGTAGVALAVALFMSYSRGAWLACVAGASLLCVFAIKHRGGRSSILPIALLPLLLVVGVSLTASGRVRERVMSVAEADGLSFLVRRDIWAASLRTIGDYPLIGVGLDAFRYVGPRYEGGLGPDKIAVHSHNDWLELPAAVGIPGAFMLMAIAGAGAWRVWRRLWRGGRRPVVWLGLGALCGLAAVGTHELLDFGLQLPGNAVVCACVMAMAVRCAEVVSRDPPRGPSLTPMARLIVTVGAVGLLAWSAWDYVHTALAGWPLSRVELHLDPTEAPRHMPEREEAEYVSGLAAAVLAHDPDNELATFAVAAQRHRLARESVREVAVSRLSAMVGHDVAAADVFEPQYSAQLDSVIVGLDPAERASTAAHLAGSLEASAKVCGMAPTNGHYFAFLGRAIENDGIWTRIDESAALRAYLLAHELWPNLGEVTHLCAEGAWHRYHRFQASRGQDGAMPSLASALTLFHLAMEQSPRTADSTYPTLWAEFSNATPLSAATPALLPSRERLYAFLYRKGRSFDCLEQIGIMTTLNEMRPDAELPATVGARGFMRRDLRSRDEVRVSLLRRRVSLLGQLGQWDERHASQDSLHDAVRRLHSPQLSAAEAALRRRDYWRVRAAGQALVDADPAWPQATILFGSALLRTGDDWGALRELSRLAYQEGPLDGQVSAAALSLLQDVRASSAGKNDPLPLTGILRTAFLARGGGTEPEQTMRELDDLLHAMQEGPARLWPNRHLLLYWKGLAMEAAGQRSAAATQYAAALTCAPMHLPSALRLVATSSPAPPPATGTKESGATDSASTEVTPLAQAQAVLAVSRSVPDMQADFAGGLRLLGLSCSPPVLSAADGLEVLAVWQCLSPVDREPQVICEFVADGQTVFADRYGFGECAPDAVTWRVGELVEVRRSLAPGALAVRQSYSNLPEGAYCVRVCLLTKTRHGSTDMAPLAVPVFPAFQVRHPVPAAAPGHSGEPSGSAPR